MKKTNPSHRQDAFKEWKLEANILVMPKSIVEKVEEDFLEKEKMIRRWEEEAQYFRDIGENEEADLCLDEAHEIQNELLEYLSIKKIAS